MPGAESAIVPSRSKRTQLHGFTVHTSVLGSGCSSFRTAGDGWGRSDHTSLSASHLFRGLLSDECGSEESGLGVVESAQRVVVECDTPDSAVTGEGARLRFDLLRGEHPG